MLNQIYDSTSFLFIYYAATTPGVPGKHCSTSLEGRVDVLVCTLNVPAGHGYSTPDLLPRKKKSHIDAI